MCFTLSRHIQVYLMVERLCIFMAPFEIWVISGLVHEELAPVIVVRVFEVISVL
jgi:hypothetical protein